MELIMQRQAPEPEISPEKRNSVTGNRQNAETPPEKGQNEINQLISSLPTILIGLSKENRIVLWNSNAEKLFGKNQSDVKGLPLEQCGVAWEWDKIAGGGLPKAELPVSRSGWTIFGSSGWTVKSDILA